MPVPRIPGDVQGSPVRLAVVPSAAVERLPDPALCDCLDATDPDLLVVTEGTAAARLRTTVPVPVRSLAGDFETGPTVDPLVDATVVTASDRDDLAALDAGATGDGPVAILADHLALDVDPASLSADLTGLDGYATALDPTIRERAVHLTPAAPPDYHRRWEAPDGDDVLTVVGCGPPDDEPATVTTVALAPDGTTTDTLHARTLGLRSVDAVGAKTARRLRHGGISDRAALADADPSTVAAIDGIDAGRADRIVTHARANRDGEVVVHDAGAVSVPSGPLFVDVETDGLRPTAVWLICVLDRTRDDPLVSFRVTDPDRPGEAVAAFAAWLTANAPDRPIVAYNGDRFDVPVLTRHVREHAPDHLQAWSDRSTADPLRWVREGAVVLPGRTNELDRVAAAIGYDGPEEPVDGAVAARRYRRWAAGGPAPDVDRFERYCEADTRKLATVHDAVRAAVDDATRVAGEQGKLTDFHHD
ncbi:hypothetical protein BRD17_00145 [Halobacteriales archaeon SW_7_68_16]|nr:MAG: hypothetical protein BRD17_00145 [Halobacteriales archaeon SW_7_68_16]